VFPATTPLERNDIGGASADSFLVAMKHAIPPVGAARNDYDIFTGLAERLGVADQFTEGRAEMDWLRHLYDRYVFNRRNFPTSTRSGQRVTSSTGTLSRGNR
jgi:biotin/methionine sulfoxide reductase